MPGTAPTSTLHLTHRLIAEAGNSRYAGQQLVAGGCAISSSKWRSASGATAAAARRSIPHPTAPARPHAARAAAMRCPQKPGRADIGVGANDTAIVGQRRSALVTSGTVRGFAAWRVTEAGPVIKVVFWQCLAPSWADVSERASSRTTRVLAIRERVGRWRPGARLARARPVATR